MLGHPAACTHRGGGVIRQSYGGHSERETPGPIPNPEVKPFSADGTATERLWESRTPPDIHSVEATVRWPLLHFCTFPFRSSRSISRGRSASQPASVRRRSPQRGPPNRQVDRCQVDRWQVDRRQAAVVREACPRLLLLLLLWGAAGSGRQA